MIEKFIITNSLSESLELELKHPEKSGIYVKEVTGLGYPSSNVSITSLVTSDIGHYNQSIYSSRNVVFTLGFLSDVENNRQKIYDAFIPKMEVRVDIITDAKELYLIGIVETCEPNIFSEDETIQVSLICPNPYLIGVDPISKNFEGSPIVVKTKREIEQGYQIIISAPDGIDNIEIDYKNGKIFYGSTLILDPYITEDKMDQNFIKKGEKLIIDSSVNRYGIYILNANGVSEEITQSCVLEGDFPIFQPGNNIINLNAVALYLSDNIDQFREVIGDPIHKIYEVMSLSYEVDYYEETEFIPSGSHIKSLILFELTDFSITGIDVKIQDYEEETTNESLQPSSELDVWNYIGLLGFNISDSIRNDLTNDNRYFFGIIEKAPNDDFQNRPVDRFAIFLSNGSQTGIEKYYILEPSDSYANPFFINKDKIINPIRDEILLPTDLLNYIYKHVRGQLRDIKLLVYQTKTVNPANVPEYNAYGDITDQLETTITYPDYHNGL